MAIDLGASNTTRYHSVPDHSDFTLPDGDWAWITLAALAASANPRYLISTNGVGASNSFNLLVASGTNQVAVQVNTSALLEAPSVPTAGTWIWMYATRRGGSLFTGWSPVNAASSANESIAQAISGTSNGSLLYIGARNDLNTARFWLGRWGQVAFVSGAGITAAQAVELANGAPLLGMSFAPSIKFLLHGKNANDATISDLISGHLATKQGTSYGTSEEDRQTPYVWAPDYFRGITSVGGSSGIVAYTNANDTSSATGATTVTGSSSTVNANDTSAASGNTTITGSLATANADDTSAASGSVDSSVSGTVAYANADDVVAASGMTTVVGSASVTGANDTSSASGTTTVTGLSATTNADDTVTASGESDLSVTGGVACTNANDSASAIGATTVTGSLAQTNNSDTAAASGVINNGIVVESALTTGAATTTSIKKPGVPSGTPEWLKTLLETIIGRRGNSIEVPKFQSLTFSATPTKAECEALYSYTNSIRTAVQDILTRLDS